MQNAAAHSDDEILEPGEPLRQTASVGLAFSLAVSAGPLRRLKAPIMSVRVC